MELLSPDLALILWTSLSFLCLGFAIAALVRLSRAKHLEPKKKLMWALIILFIPIIGSFVFIALGRTKKGYTPGL